MRRVKLLFVVIALFLSVAAYADRPPIIPSNSCEAQCLVDYRACRRICDVNPCLVSCEFLLDLCVDACAAS